MEKFMVVCTFTSGTDMAEVMEVVAQEQEKVKELTSAGKIGALFLATRERGTVFLEVIAADSDDARQTVLSLPMSKWWDLDFYPLNAPVAREESADKS